jgi:hypothetical protein
MNRPFFRLRQKVLQIVTQLRGFVLTLFDISAVQMVEHHRNASMPARPSLPLHFDVSVDIHSQLSLAVES